MKLKTYQGPTMAAALAQVKRELGPDAVILHTRTYRRGGVLGFGARSVVEITASDEVATQPRRKPPRRGVVERAYNAPTPNTAATKAQAIKPPAQPNQHIETASAVSQMPPNPTSSSSQVQMDPQLTEELRQLRRLVQRVARSQANQPQPLMPEALGRQYLRMLEQDVADELADEIAQKVGQKTADAAHDPAAVRRAICAELAQLIPVDTEPTRIDRHDDGRPHTVALIGPTGVGKTTTLAKLAANFRLRDKRKVGMVTLDTYRIAAVDQLKTYAQIIGVELQVARSPLEVKQALEACANCDIVLIDTAGRSQRDDGKLTQLRAMLDVARPHETHLVLSGAAGERVLMQAVERFGNLGIDRVIFTKLDETVSFGVLVNVMTRVKGKLSYITTGQDVPNDIERGHSRRLAELILGETSHA